MYFPGEIFNTFPTLLHYCPRQQADIRPPGTNQPEPHRRPCRHTFNSTALISRGKVANSSRKAAYHQTALKPRRKGERARVPPFLLPEVRRRATSLLCKALSSSSKRAGRSCCLAGALTALIILLPPAIFLPQVPVSGYQLALLGQEPLVSSTAAARLFSSTPKAGRYSYDQNH